MYQALNLPWSQLGSKSQHFHTIPELAEVSRVLRPRIGLDALYLREAQSPPWDFCESLGRKSQVSGTTFSWSHLHMWSKAFRRNLGSFPKWEFLSPLQSSFSFSLASSSFLFLLWPLTLSASSTQYGQLVACLTVSYSRCLILHHVNWFVSSISFLKWYILITPPLPSGP